MSADREALLERFRAGLLARIERIDGLLDQAGENGSAAELRKEALGELHTLKGEGRMLGLGSLSDVAHSLETFLGQDGAKRWRAPNARCHAQGAHSRGRARDRRRGAGGGAARARRAA